MDRYARILAGVDLLAALVGVALALLRTEPNVPRWMALAAAVLLPLSWLAALTMARCYEPRFLGDGGDPEMLAAIRAHANFIEFVPLTLLLIFVVMDHYGGRTSGTLAAILLVSRLFHAGGMLGFVKYGRTIGAMGTMTVLVVSSLWIILYVLGLKPY